PHQLTPAHADRASPPTRRSCDLATDHAPHAEAENAQPMTKAPFGIVGSETAFPLLYTHFVKNGDWSLQQLVDYLTIKPSKTFGLDRKSTRLNSSHVSISYAVFCL